MCVERGQNFDFRHLSLLCDTDKCTGHTAKKVSK